ncbi:MAG: response regulator transcription factor [Alphaproteobacteria bacterium]|jgi:DNA-binding response OmpR family regulator
MRLLLVEDTQDVADAVVASFVRRGDAIDHADSVQAARDSLAVQDYDVVILDINLPDGSGTEVLRGMRDAGCATPVLMLTARGEVEDRVSALDIGADDYLVKPFDLRELEARVRALVRRTGTERAGVVAYGDLEFDPAGQTVTLAGAPLDLTRRELNLLETLLVNRGRVVAKERIFERMFAFNDEDVGLNAVEIYIGRLRRKLGGSRVAIRTLRGLGYQLHADD